MSKIGFSSDDSLIAGTESFGRDLIGGKLKGLYSPPWGRYFAGDPAMGTSSTLSPLSPRA